MSDRAVGNNVFQQYHDFNQRQDRVNKESSLTIKASMQNRLNNAQSEAYSQLSFSNQPLKMGAIPPTTYQYDQPGGNQKIAVSSVHDLLGQEVKKTQATASKPTGQYSQTGAVSWYGPGFHGNIAANGKPFDQNAMTAAHRTLPFGTKLLVTDLDTGKHVEVIVTDRGPYSGGRILDLSKGAAQKLGIINTGVASNVKIEHIE